MTMDKIGKLREFLTDYRGIQTFNTRNIVGDRMNTIYDSDGIQVDICYGWDYLEIFGLTDEEYQSLSDILNIC
jgi:hypothetical protein